MDIVESCKDIINMQLKEIERCHDEDDHDEFQSQTLNVAETFVVDKDKNLNKILSQQAYLKRIIDEDNHIQMLKSSLTKISIEIDSLRKTCTKINADAIKNRQEDAVTQAKDVERYQMGQLRSIAEDYSRHQDILEQRKKEIQALKRQIEKEEKERDAYLADVEKKLEKQLQDRQKLIRDGSLPFQLKSGGADDLTEEFVNPDHIELTSVDEYAPYGVAPHSRIPQPTAPGSGRVGGRGRGRRRRG